jgi:predicted O-linked N-acetylglucosamine transferase (SPINDLY family)
MDPLLKRGFEHHQAGRLREAEIVYRQLLQRQPSNPDALHLLGLIAAEARQHQHAVQLIHAAIKVRPDVAFYHNNLGNSQRGLGDLGAAEASYRHALRLRRDYADAQINLGTVLREMARFEEAAAAYEQVVRTNPSVADAHANLGTVYKDQGRIEEALASYRRAIELNPRHPNAHDNLLYVLHDSDRVTPAELFEAHRSWAAEHAEPLTRAAKTLDNDRTPDRRLKIGYLSADFRDHPVARFLWPLIEQRDRANFEVACFSGVEKLDSVSHKYRAAVDEWHDVAPMSDEQLAEHIRSRQIDVLVDLAGHTQGGRLLTFARRAAPVQLTYLGYPDTTGMSAMDVRITDALADPPDADARHTERLARVDGCFLCYPFAADLPPIAPSPMEKNGYPTIGSFNNLAKISPTTIQLWTKVLQAIPDARMIIKTTSLGDAGTRKRAAARFASLGLPMDRVELLGPTRTQAEHLATYARIDFALDTFPYNGTTTTCEARAMGVPVVSLAGQHHASRVGLSLNTAAGYSYPPGAEQSFLDEACEYGMTILDREAMREKLRSSTLCDAPAFARKIEKIYRDEWLRWCGT